MLELLLGIILGLVLGMLLGAGLVALIGRNRAQQARDQLREAFGTLAAEALDANAQRLTTQTAAALDGKKQLIDHVVETMNERLEQVRDYLQRVERERKEDFGRLSGSVTSLGATTGELHRMLASTQRRGAWGERMAEDVLRLAGLQESINYTRQSSADAIDGRPDFTFFLPNDLKVNMDVKFPLERYKAYLDAEGEEQTRQMRQFLTAVRGHMRAVAGRGYVDTAGGTVPYVILFIPSEQIYCQVLSACPDLIDEALQQRVVLCGPLTLYATLAVIRQAAENANILHTANEVLSLLGEFHRQWDKYNEEMDKLGSRLESTLTQYQAVRTTRSNMLERPLRKIEDLRESAGA